MRYIIDELKISDFPAEGNIPFKNVNGVPVKILNEIPVQLICGKKTPVFVLEITGLDDDKIRLSYLASSIITSFRLANERGIGYSLELKAGDIPTKIEGEGLPYRYPKDRGTIYSIPYNDISKIECLAWDIGSIFLQKDDLILRYALSRFNRSFDEINEEDVLLDLVICLEVLFVHDKCILCHQVNPEKRNTLRDKLVPFLRDAFIDHEKFKGGIQLEDERNRMERIMNGMIDAAYNIRNDIAHLGKRIEISRLKGTGCITVWDFILKIREYARFSLRGYIKWLSKNKEFRAEDIKLAMQKDKDLNSSTIRDVAQKVDKIKDKRNELFTNIFPL